MTKRLRQPVICVLGHVDSGKTTLLDKIRGTAVASREVGSMTQHIGASFFPLETLKEICGPLFEKIRAEIKIPGLLVIDTPGHSVFVNLRKRGGSVADIAILVMDVIRGFEAQTYECIDILKSRKTPFVVATNKIDLIPGWKVHPGAIFSESFKGQSPLVQRGLDERLYGVMGTFSRLGFKADRFDRIVDFTKTIALVPVSAKTGEGIPDLLTVLIGLTQQYMQQRLLTSEGSGKGTVLEVKEEPGLGMTVNVILYDGVLHKGDVVVIGGREKPIVTKVRAILLPKPLDEIRDPRDRFTPVGEVSAAAGVKIAASDLENALAGAPIYGVGPSQSVEDLVGEVSEEVDKLRVKTDKVGVVLKTDTLGSLEAMVSELENNGIPIRWADVGDVSRRDVVEASMVRQEAPLQGVVLVFSVRVLPDAMEEANAQGVPIFQNDVIYRLIEDYTQWLQREQEAMISKRMEALVKPGKVRVLPGFVFRKSKPAVFGVEVLAGRIQPKCNLVGTDGRGVGEILQIQDKGQSVSEATSGMKVAVSMREPVVGKDFNEGDVLYVEVPDGHVRELLTSFQSRLTPEELRTLNELVEIMRKGKPFWGL